MFSCASPMLAEASLAPETTNVKCQRNMQSYHKVNLFNSFVTSRVVVAGREPQEEGEVRGPQLSRRALAATQGEQLPETRGVFHTKSEGKQARDTAKAAYRESANHPAVFSPSS